MIRPDLLDGMEQGRQIPCLWIDGRNAVRLVEITTGTGQDRVSFIGGSPFRSRDYMLKVERWRLEDSGASGNTSIGPGRVP